MTSRREPANPEDDTRSMRERMLAGDLHRGADAELEAEMADAQVLTRRFNDSDPRDPAARRLLTPTHPVDPEPRRATWEAALPITTGNPARVLRSVHPR